MNAMWDSFQNRLWVTGTLQAETAIRIGCGSESVLPTAADLPVFREREEPIIPGSSLRGAVRSHLERIFRTLEPECGHGRGACRVLDDETRCISNKRYEQLQDESKGDPEKLYRQVYELSCRMCRLFGSPWLASRIRFQDARPVNDVDVVRRDGVAINREKETVENKYDFEVVNRGARFRLEIVAENLTTEELGVLFLALHELRESRVLVGGFKGRGLGSVRLVEARVQMVDGTNRDQLLGFLTTGRRREVPDSEIESTLKALTEGLAKVG